MVLYAQDDSLEQVSELTLEKLRLIRYQFSQFSRTLNQFSAPNLHAEPDLKTWWQICGSVDVDQSEEKLIIFDTGKGMDESSIRQW